MIKLCYNRKYLEEGDPDVEFKEELPKTISGKIRRVELKG